MPSLPKSLLNGSLLRALLLTIALLSGCATKAGGPEHDQGYLTHTIAYQGETLRIISAWYTGSGQNWHEIEAANPDVKPNRLRPGMVIRIPRVLLIRETKLPKSYVEGVTAKSRSAAEQKTAEKEVASTQPSQGLPKAAPPVEESGTDTTAVSSMPALPDPNAHAVSSVTVPSSSSEAAVQVSSAPPSSVAAVSSVAAANISSSSSSAAVTSSSEQRESDRQKSRDQLLKELMSDY